MAAQYKFNRMEIAGSLGKDGDVAEYVKYAPVGAPRTREISGLNA